MCFRYHHLQVFVFTVFQDSYGGVFVAVVTSGVFVAVVTEGASLFISLICE